MNLFKLYLISTLFVIIGCGNNPSAQDYIAPKFNEILHRSITVLNDEFLFSHVRYITVVDSLLIAAFQTPSNANYFHIFNKHTGVYLKSFGGIGRGPGELLSATGVSYSLDPVSKKLYVNGHNDKRIIVFDILRAMEEVFVPFEEIPIDAPATYTSRNDFYYKNDIFLFANSNPFRFALLSSVLDTVAAYHTYPVITEEDIDNESARKIFNGAYSRTNFKPDRTRFVNTTLNGLLMEIFDLSNDKIELLYLRRYIKPSYRLLSSVGAASVTVVGNPKGLSFPTVSDSYIYGVHLDNVDGKSTRKKLMVFDWEGHPVKCYQLNMDIAALAIDEEGGFAYVVSDNDEPAICRFPL